MKTFVYYLKQTFIPIIYTLFSAVMALGIVSTNWTGWLKVALLVLNLILHVYIIFTFNYKEGQDALKVRTVNDLERVNIIKTGEDRKLDTQREYKAHKGIIIGLYICIPLFILMVIHAIILLSSSASASLAGGTAAFLYHMVYGLFYVLDETASCFYCLLYAPLVIAVTGLSYYLGARKIENQQNSIRETHRQIYGD